MSDPSTEFLRTEAAKDRHLARVERLLTREGVSLTVADRVSGLVKVDVGADDAAIGAAIKNLKRELPGVFAVSPAVEEAESSAHNAGHREAERRFGKTSK